MVIVAVDILLVRALQITTSGYSYDGVGNMTAAPGETVVYSAQQLTASTKDGVTTTYKYAGADMLKLLHQAADGGAEYDYTYGTCRDGFALDVFVPSP